MAAPEFDIYRNEQFAKGTPFVWHIFRGGPTGCRTGYIAGTADNQEKGILAGKAKGDLELAACPLGPGESLTLFSARNGVTNDWSRRAVFSFENGRWLDESNP